MPELPEVETMRRGILPIVGSRIADVWRPPSKLQPTIVDPPVEQLRKAIVGQRIAGVGRLGKRVVLELDDGSRVVIEPRMTGRVLLGVPRRSALSRRKKKGPYAEEDQFVPVRSEGSGSNAPHALRSSGRATQTPVDASSKIQDLRPKTHLRLVFELVGGPAGQLLFWDSRGLGVVRLRSAEELKSIALQIGPDAQEISAQVLRQRICASRRAIKVALMDQQAVAGIGNLYASEILHRARLNPEVRCDRLRPADWRRLATCIHEVLEEAILHQGSTLSDGMYRTAENQSGGYQDQHRVYQRAGEPCLACGKGTIVRIVQAQRSTFFCPRCQRG